MIPKAELLDKRKRAIQTCKRVLMLFAWSFTAYNVGFTYGAKGYKRVVKQYQELREAMPAISLYVCEQLISNAKSQNELLRTVIDTVEHASDR